MAKTAVVTKRYNLRHFHPKKTNSVLSDVSAKRTLSTKTKSSEVSIGHNDAKKRLDIKDVEKIGKRSLKDVSGSSATKIEKKRRVIKQQKISSDDFIIKSKDNLVNNKYVGAHVSISGGLHNAVTNAIAIGAKSFGLFLRSQRQWASKPLTVESANLFCQACNDHKISPHLILPHGSYLLNCGSPKEEILRKSREALIDELKRCEMLGLMLFNFHPGSTCGEISINECLDRIGESINLAHSETNHVITVVENMCKQGHTIGGDFKELRGIIDRVKDKSRIGVCLDTCHTFAAGYDISSKEGFDEMMRDFENIIGFKYLKGVHLNDSMGKVGCHLDRHENIGKGHIGLNGFKYIMNDHRFNNLPMILETPANLDDSKEIEILYGLCK